MEIKTSRFTLRKWRDTDAEALVRVANNKKVYDNLRDLFPYPYNLNDAKTFINIAMQDYNDKVFFAIDIDGIAVGSVAITTQKDIYRKNAEIGYFIGEDYWGKGYMTGIIKELVKIAFEKYDIVRIFAEPFADNIASKKALEKSGFTHEATFRKNIIKNGIIKDSCIYSILKEEYEKTM